MRWIHPWVLALALGCVADRESTRHDPGADSLGTLRIVLNASRDHVAGFLVLVEGEGIETQKYVPLPESAHSGDEGPEPTPSDAELALPSGRYEVTAYPMRMSNDGRCVGGAADCRQFPVPAELCEPHQTTVEVFEHRTTEATFESHCGHSVPFSRPPAIHDLLIVPSKFGRVCEPSPTGRRL